MSITWMNAAWGCDTGSATRKAVLIVLADHADEDGFCWPRVRTICERTELSDRTVRKAIGELEDDGFIHVVEEYEPAGRQTSNVYQLVIPPVSRAGGRVQQLQGPPARRAPSTRTTNEPSDGRTPSRRRSATSSAPAGRSSKFRGSQPDDPTDDGSEGPALGATGPASPKRKTQAEADVVAADRGTSGRGLAVRLRDGLDATDLPTSHKIVDVGLLGKRLNELHRKGMPRDVQAKCVELYVASPSRYKLGDSKGWTGFLEALPKLEADAAGHVRVEQGGARFGGAYDGVDE